MKKFNAGLLLTAIALTVVACGGGTDVVESGTYNGTISEINADEMEIYVETDSDQLLELYFTESTTLTQDGESIPFSDLEQGDRVEIRVERVGQRLDPVSVRRLE